MRIRDSLLGVCEVSIQHGISAVDSFIEYGYSETFDRDLTDLELEYLTDRYSGEIQAESYSGGYSRNHN